jgi:hypothetical protein
MRILEGIVMSSTRGNVYHIGIDPGVNTGLVIVNARNDKEYHEECTDFWGCTKVLTAFFMGCAAINNSGEMLPAKQVLIWIENPDLNSPVFQKKAQKMNRRQRDKLASDIGKNKMQAQLLIAFCRQQGWQVIEVRPTTPKWSEKEARLYLGRVVKNEHIRDGWKYVQGKGSQLHTYLQMSDAYKKGSIS